jgi:hypothetical protein
MQKTGEHLLWLPVSGAREHYRPGLCPAFSRQNWMKISFFMFIDLKVEVIYTQSFL